MKTLFIGGMKSGKSTLAEAYILRHVSEKPYYLATTELMDDEMSQRVAVHRERRQDRFITLQEPVKLYEALLGCAGGAVLVECVSMWLNNMLYYQIPEDLILQELNSALQLSLDTVFVQNEVGMGIVPDNPLVRQYIDLSGKASQMLGAYCHEVYFCCAGLSMRLK